MITTIGTATPTTIVIQTTTGAAPSPSGACDLPLDGYPRNRRERRAQRFAR